MRKLVPGRVVLQPATAPKLLGLDLGMWAIKVMGPGLGAEAVKGRAGDSNVAASAAMFEPFSDADTVFSAGWDEKALHDAIATTGRASFMQRLVEGTWLHPVDE